MPFAAACHPQQQQPASRPSAPVRAVRLPGPAASAAMSFAYDPLAAGPVYAPIGRALVRSAGLMQLQAGAALQSVHAPAQPAPLTVYASSEDDDSGDEHNAGRHCAAAHAKSHLPSYASVYSNIRQAATQQAHRQRERQTERTQLSVAWEQLKRGPPAAAAAGAIAAYAKRPPVSPALRSTLSTASESSQLSAYSSGSDSGSGCDTDSEREASSAGSASHGAARCGGRQSRRESRPSQRPQHFTFSVDDIDKALTEADLDEWFDTDEHAQDASGDSSEDDKSDDEPHHASSLRTHIASSSPSSALSSSYTASPSASPLKALRPLLSIDTASTDASDSESTITILPTAAASSAEPAKRRFVRSSLPTTFTFSRSDIRKAHEAPSDELNVGHWHTFPRPSVAVCDVRALRGRLREKRDEWDRQPANELPQQAAEEKREPPHKPNASRRLFVEPAAAAGAARARQSVVMWRRDSHAAPVAPLPQSVPMPVPQPMLATFTPDANANQIAAAQHRRAATAYSNARTSQPAQSHTHSHYQPPALMQLHHNQRQQPTRHHATHTPHHQLPYQPLQHPYAQHHALNHSAAVYAHPRLAYAQSAAQQSVVYQPAAASHNAADLFSPRKASKQPPCAAASYQPNAHLFALQHNPHLQHAAAHQLQHGYHAYSAGVHVQHYHSADPCHYLPYAQDALHSLKPAGSAGLSHEVWLAQQAHSGAVLTAHSYALERCVSAAAATQPAPAARQTSHPPPHSHVHHSPYPLHPDWQSTISLPAAAHHKRGISAPQRC